MSELDLKEFEKNIVVRTILPEDYSSITLLQESCFPGMKPWTHEQFDSQLKIFPEGQICVEYEGRIVASSSSLILDFSLYSEWHSWKEIADNGFIRNHNPEGNTLYGIEIMVDPAYRGMRLARRLYDARKSIATRYNLMRIILGGRIPGYGDHAHEMTARAYVGKVIDKSLFDPVLTTQLANGFVLKRLLRDYMVSDSESKGYATFLEWTNLDYVPDTTRIYMPVESMRVCAVQYQIRMVRDFEDFAKQCEYFIDVGADYRSDIILFPEIFTSQFSLSFQRTGRRFLSVACRNSLRNIWNCSSPWR